MREPAFRNGLSISPFTEELLARGIAFVDGDVTARDLIGLQRLYLARGSTEVFARVGTSLTGADRDARAQLETRCALARDLGMPLNPELTLCGTYGDISRQPPPDFSHHPAVTLPRGKRWSQLTIDEMSDALRTYGTFEARNILGRGCQVVVWDIGNEVEYGVAGVAIKPSGPAPDYEAPDAVNPEIGTKAQLGGFFGELEWLQHELWPYVARLLAAVAEGIRVVDANAKVATHCSTITPFLPGALAAFHRAMADGGFRADDLGTSWYPGSTPLVEDGLSALEVEAAKARELLGAPVYIAEYGYAAGPATYGGADWANPIDGYPVSPAGQAALLRDLTEWGAHTGNISGVRPWAPDLVDGGWAGLAMFELRGGTAVARPAVQSMMTGVRRARASKDRH